MLVKAAVITIRAVTTAAAAKKILVEDRILHMMISLSVEKLVPIILFFKSFVAMCDDESV